MHKQISAERRQQLAELHRVNEQYLYQCLTGRRDMNPAQAMTLETETGGELTRQMLCQKTYAGIWPGLDPEQGVPITPAKGGMPKERAQAAEPRGTGPRERRQGKPDRRVSPRSIAQRIARTAAEPSKPPLTPKPQGN